ncbi:hypothetical protein Bca101_065916 [Brassica carinata]
MKVVNESDREHECRFLSYGNLATELRREHGFWWSSCTESAVVAVFVVAFNCRTKARATSSNSYVLHIWSFKF